eukprot:GEMP01007834.1.p1 GENE.GEMP01007834.1~~GEMP01007834.1.p1  ORF type:complete len:772 (+),score=126.22 GEMP01007834.1:677-2992(+)
MVTFYANTNSNMFNGEHRDLCICLFTLHNILRSAGIATLLTRRHISYAAKDMCMLMMMSVCARVMWYVPIHMAVDVFVCVDVLVVIMSVAKVFTSDSKTFDIESPEKIPPFMGWKRLGIMGCALCVQDDSYCLDMYMSTLALLPWLWFTPNNNKHEKGFCGVVFGASRLCTFVLHCFLSFGVFIIFLDAFSVVAIVWSHFAPRFQKISYVEDWEVRNARSNDRSDRNDRITRQEAPRLSNESKEHRTTYKSWREESLVPALKSQDVSSWLAAQELTTETINSALVSCSKRSDVATVVKLFAKLKEANLQPDRTSYHAVLIVCSQNGAAEQATEWFYKMIDDGIACHTASINHIISAYAKRGHWNQAEWWFSQIAKYKLSPSILSFHAVMNAYAKVGNFTMAEYWFNQIWAYNLNGMGEVSTYNIIIDAAVKADLPDKAEEWFEKLKAANLTPDRVTFNSLMCVNAKAHRMERLLYYFNMILETGTPDIAIYHSLMDAYAKRDDPDEVARRFDELVGLGLVPTIQTFNSVIGAFSRVGNANEAIAWFSKTVESGLEPNVITYNCIIDCFARGSNLDAALHWYGELLTLKHLVPTQITYGTIVKAYTNSQMPHEAEQFISEITEAGVGRIDVVSACLIIASYARMGAADEAETVFYHMYDIGLTPNVIHFNALLNGFAQCGDMDKLVQTIDQMIREKTKMDDVTLYIVLNAAKKTHRCDLADYFLTNMKTVKRKQRHFAVLMSMSGPEYPRYLPKWKTEMERLGISSRANQRL